MPDAPFHPSFPPSAVASPTPPADARGWTREAIAALFALPFNDLLWRAQAVHRAHFDANTVQLSQLLSIKTGACPEDCGYCPQSARFAKDTGLKAEPLMPLDAVLAAARQARANGATRFCMGAAYRSPKDGEVARVAAMVEGVKALGLETCVTLGMLTPSQCGTLKNAGLDYYNHNLDTSPEFYGRVITTRTYADRLQTLDNVRAAGVKVCCGGIVGMGESVADRAGLIHQLAALDPYPESVPINALVRAAGTPLAEQGALDPFDFARMVAVARITMPKAHVRLSAGREALGDAGQALCFLAGANSIFYGEKLLTTANPEADADRRLFARLGLVSEAGPALADDPAVAPPVAGHACQGPGCV